FRASSSNSWENNELRSEIGLMERLMDILVDEGDEDLFFSGAIERTAFFNDLCSVKVDSNTAP
ncbi:hypothetical protein, partial [Salmonella sp. s39606]|uniref:hypothetical protein n=1 Tax=Salmonella sp. s39606 TaxID=3159643 RepID=UPI0039803890